MESMRKVILTTAYFAPVQYYSKLKNADLVLIEQHDNYTKQSYRNRCAIYGANGLLTLSIPIVKGKYPKIKTRDICIDYATNWQLNHWKSIESAYRSAPFFEYYVDAIIPFFNKQYKFLIDYNMEIQKATLDQLDIAVACLKTEAYIHEYEFYDLRQTIHPKRDSLTIDDTFVIKEYYQIFSMKHGFIPNLSIIDLLFNEGPAAVEYL